MANKKQTKKGAYTEKKNGEALIKVIERTEEIQGEQLFPQSTQIVPVKEFDKPLISIEDAISSFEQYQGLITALMKTSDIIEVNGVKKAKKSGINKIARFFGYSCEIIRAYKEDIVGPQGGKSFIWRVWAKAIAPTGRFRVAGAACDSLERRFAHINHDVMATAETRAKKRAIEELAGMGELELADEDNTSSIGGSPQNADQSDNNNNFMGTGDPDTWKPIFKVNNFSKFVPSNDKMPISEKAVEWLKTSVKRAGIELDDNTKVLFILNNRADGMPRTKEINQLNKGDFYDISETIKRKGKEGLIKLIEIVKKEIPTGEPPQSDGSIYDKGEIPPEEGDPTKEQFEEVFGKD